MTYVVTEGCLNCKYTLCVDVCPAEAFHEADDILYINPKSCIDCDACVSECPEEAIFSDFDLPDRLRSWIIINATEALKFPVISESRLSQTQQNQKVMS